MKNWLLALFAAAALGTAGSVSAQEGDIERGQAKANACAACHGADGNSQNPQWPKLAGLDQRYIFTQLQAYQSGERKDPMMTPQAQPLSEQDMRDLSAFYANQAMAPGAADEALAEQGERIYRGGIADKGVAACMACHGPAGNGIPSAGYPRIGGQHAEYVATQLQRYRAGERTTDPNRMMRDLAQRMSDEEIRAVASYVSGLYRRQ
jgi:cytochrome c553